MARGSRHRKGVIGKGRPAGLWRVSSVTAPARRGFYSAGSRNIRRIAR